MTSADFLLTNLWLLIIVSGFISACFTYLWYAYYEDKWPFHKTRRQ